MPRIKDGAEGTDLRRKMYEETNDMRQAMVQAAVLLVLYIHREGLSEDQILEKINEYGFMEMSDAEFEQARQMAINTMAGKN